MVIVVTMISLFLIIVQVSLLVYGRKIIDSDVDQKNRRASSTSSAYTFCDSPVTKGKVTFPQSIAGRASVVDKMEMYSGYVKISNAPDYLFYWFFSSQDQNASAPLVIWTNGSINAILNFEIIFPESASFSQVVQDALRWKALLQKMVPKYVFLITF